jgi:hypothetical protein
MRVTVTSGSASSALGLAGTGLALVWPDQKWIGGILIALAVLIFLFDIRVERGKFRASSGASFWQRLTSVFVREIPLLEAATRAYEKTRSAPISIVSETFSDSAPAILIWYCDQMTRYIGEEQPLVRLYGNRPPSRRKEEIYMASLNMHVFVVEDNAIILQDSTGMDRYENLVVNSSEVSAAIAELAKRQV